MIKSTLTHKANNGPKPFPKLMRGIKTDTIYFAIKLNAWNQSIECIVLHPGNDKSTRIGDRNTYDAFLFEDFDGSVTLTNVG